MIEDFLAEGLCFVKLSKNDLPVLRKSISGSLRHAFSLDYLLALDLVLLVESAQTCYRNPFVGELPVKQDHSFLQSKCTPQLECFFAEKKVQLLLFHLPNFWLVLLPTLGHRLEAADMLH